MCYRILIIIFLSSNCLYAQFAPHADSLGSTAVYIDDKSINSWIDNIKVTQGWEDIRDTNLIKVTNGKDSSALGKADNKTISLGEGGFAIITLKSPIKDDSGPEFAIFENAFDDEFLELAFVEVSENGIDYYRFPSESLTDTLTQVGGFGKINATKIHNLAGKYRVYYGTPFDLQDLSNQNINLNNINYIKLIDITGNIKNPQRDSKKRIINDPWPTPFFSCGFDLDAVALLKPTPNGIEDISFINGNIYPNPADELINFNFFNIELFRSIEIFSTSGQNVYQKNESFESVINIKHLQKGSYFVKISTEKESKVFKLIKI